MEEAILVILTNKIFLMSLFAIVILIFIVLISNRFTYLILKVEEADSDIDVSLIKRHEVLTKMVEVVKAYTKHEKENLIKLAEIKKGMSLAEKKEANKSMDEAKERINILVENYPKLKAGENYLTLQKAIVDAEDHLQASRRMYNSNVSLYNQYLFMFPYMIIGKLRGLKKKEYLNFNDENTTKVEITTEK